MSLADRGDRAEELLRRNHSFRRIHVVEPVISAYDDHMLLHHDIAPEGQGEVVAF
jgi:hypothetical protein